MSFRYGIVLRIVLSFAITFEFVPRTSLVVVPVTINGRGPFRFILDTGASDSILSSAVADALAIPEGRSRRILTAGGAVPAQVRMLRIFKVGGVRLEEVEIAVMQADLMKTLQVDGVLGADYLRRFKVSIDYQNRLVDIA